VTGTEAESVLVLRVFVDRSTRAFRVRLTKVADVSAAKEEVSDATPVDRVCAEVRRWVEEIIRG